MLQGLLVLAPGVWMAVAVADNWLRPAMNEEAVAMVVRFDLLAEQYPADYALVAHRRIVDPARIRLIFRAARLAETAASAALVLAALLLVLAALGAVGATLAVAVAQASLTLFVSVWAGFIIGGNYFAYWYCHPWAQSNHFMLMFWGLLVLIAVSV